MFTIGVGRQDCLPHEKIMTKKILLTSRPGCGKTTLIKRVVNKLPLPAGGFYTEEMREAGTRVGFKLVTLDREEAVFAHVDFKTGQRVGKYGLNLATRCSYQRFRCGRYSRSLKGLNFVM